jgi:predicted ArsR family transcriptional regulator
MSQSTAPDASRIEAARDAKETWAARLAALEDGTLQWIEEQYASFTANDLAAAFKLTPQAATNRLTRLTRAGLLARHVWPGRGRSYRYHRINQLWEQVPSDLMWEYLAVLRVRAIFGARSGDAQRVCRVIADELTLVSSGRDPAAHIKMALREAHEAATKDAPPTMAEQIRSQND